MRARIATLLLGLTAALLAFDGVMHGLLWGRAGVLKIGEATKAAPGQQAALPLPFAGELQVLWQADVANLLAVATVSGLAAWSPRLAAPAVLLVLAAIPGTLAVLLYGVEAPRYVAHMQAAAAAMMVMAALLRLPPAAASTS